MLAVVFFAIQNNIKHRARDSADSRRDRENREVDDADSSSPALIDNGASAESKLRIGSVESVVQPTNQGDEVATFIVQVENPTGERLKVSSLAVVVQDGEFRPSGPYARRLKISQIDHKDHITLSISGPNVGSRNAVNVALEVVARSTIEVGIWIRLGYETGRIGFFDTLLTIELQDENGAVTSAEPFEAKIYPNVAEEQSKMAFQGRLFPCETPSWALSANSTLREMWLQDANRGLMP